MALLGESGSGKSVSALAVMGLLDPPARITDGEIRYRGETRTPRPGREAAMVFQDALTSLNPVMRCRGARSPSTSTSAAPSASDGRSS